MSNHSVYYSRDASNDLDAIVDYVAVDSKKAAIALLNQLEQAIFRLKANPDLGIALPDAQLSLVRSGIRRYLLAPWIIFYRYDTDAVFVLRILHERQDSISALTQSNFT